MMPIYFPYTYISRKTAEILQACFGPVTVYQPSGSEVPDALRQLAAEGVIQLRAPVKNSDSRLAGILKDYRNWAALQRIGKGIDTAYLKTLQDRLPFFDDTAPEQIRSMIKDQMGGRRSADTAVDASEKLFKARIFLQLAQEFDVQNDTVSEELTRFSRMERDLIKDIQGEADGSDSSDTESVPYSHTETADYMIAQRLEAWSTLALADPKAIGADAAGIFITSNPSVIDLIEARLPETRAVVTLETTAGAGADSGPLSDRQRGLMDQLAALWAADLSEGAGSAGETLAALAAAGAETAGSGPVQVHIYAIPGKKPAAVFSTLSAGEGAAAPSQAPAGSIRNTVVVLLETTAP